MRRLDAKRLHWVANIGGTRKEWDAQITKEVPDQRIAWRSEAGECTAGVVTFQPLVPDPRYREREWATIEPDARREWDQRHRGTWEEFKDAIRHAWDNVCGRCSA